jgi:hypothetical protein
LLLDLSIQAVVDSMADERDRERTPRREPGGNPDIEGSLLGGDPQAPQIPQFPFQQVAGPQMAGSSVAGGIPGGVQAPTLTEVVTLLQLVTQQLFLISAELAQQQVPAATPDLTASAQLTSAIESIASKLEGLQPPHPMDNDKPDFEEPLPKGLRKALDAGFADWARSEGELGKTRSRITKCTEYLQQWLMAERRMAPSRPNIQQLVLGMSHY